MNTGEDRAASGAKSVPGQLAWAKSVLLASLLVPLLLAGCAQHYEITMTNGDIVTSLGRPKRDGRGYYVYKDADGRQRRVNELRVRQIEAK